MNKPKNDNYAAVVVEIKTLLPLAGCDFVQAAIIMGNQVIVSKDIKVGDIGLYFPLETQLSEAYLSNNNLYRKPEMNVDQTQKGYFEENGRIRCVKFRQNKSEGLFMPLESLNFVQRIQYGLNDLKDNFRVKNTIGTIGDTFDEIEGIEICRKYVVKHVNMPGAPGSKKSKSTKKYETKLVDGQFRFHEDTSMLYKNLHRFSGDSLISVTYKLHGTSGISSYVLCKKPVPFYTKALVGIWNFFQSFFIPGDHSMEMEDTQYDYLYSSRKVIKNAALNPDAQHYYDVDIWGLAHDKVKDFLQKGMTFYYEIVGYLPNGGMIQKDYDYGCQSFVDKSEHKIFIYRITYTNVDGKVFEFSAKQVQDFCTKNGLTAVPQVYYGFAKGLAPQNKLNPEYAKYFPDPDIDNVWKDEFLEVVKEMFNEHDCYMCTKKVPEEGVVIRVEGPDFEAYKAKSNRFYERETKLLDQGIEDIEA